jgi:hypothetical protein
VGQVSGIAFIVGMDALKSPSGSMTTVSSPGFCRRLLLARGCGSPGAGDAEGLAAWQASPQR